MAGKDGQQARLVLQGSGMSEQEVAQRLKELSSLKLHPREQEGPRNLIARGQRLYAMTVGSMREQVAQILDWFQGELVSQESIRIAKACRKVDAFFDRVEAYVGQADLPEPEDGPEEEA